MFAALILFAEDPAQGPPPWFQFLPIVFIGVMMILLMTRSARRQERERQQMMSSLTKGDEVLTVAGIYGTVISVHETKDEVVVKVDDGTRLRMTKGSIQRNLTKEEAAKAAAKS